MRKLLTLMLALSLLLCACAAAPEETLPMESVTEATDAIPDATDSTTITTEPIETTPPETKPAATIPQETKPAETTSPTKPTETTPPETTIPETTTPPDTSKATMELKSVGKLEYYLYTPKNPTSGMPLIVYLHGGSGKNVDAPGLLTLDGFPKYLNDGYYGDLRAYVAIPKLSSSYKGWVDVHTQIRDMIKSIQTNQGVSSKKIALTGHSMGGTGTYQLQIKLSNTFACIAPMSGSVQLTDANLAALAKTKIWAFVGTADTVVDPESTRVAITALQEQNANAKLTELEGASHTDVPSRAYKNKDFIKWLVNCGK